VYPRAITARVKLTARLPSRAAARFFVMAGSLTAQDARRFPARQIDVDKSSLL